MDHNILNNPRFHVIQTLRAMGTKNPIKRLKANYREFKRIRRKIRTGR